MSPNIRTSKLSLSAVLIVGMLVFSALACNLPSLSPGSSPAEESPPEEAPPAAPNDTASQRETAQAAAPQTEADTGDAPEPAAPAEPAAPPEPDPPSGSPIEPGKEPAVPDCNAFDRTAFDSIVGGSFAFVTQDQLNNCHFESDNDYRLMIGGGKPTSSAEMETQFNTTFGALPDSSWEVIENFYLGLSFSSVSVTAQGVSASGHSVVIVAASQPEADSGGQQETYGQLAREAARQLNAQW